MSKSLNAIERAKLWADATVTGDGKRPWLPRNNNGSGHSYIKHHLGFQMKDGALIAPPPDYVSEYNNHEMGQPLNVTCPQDLKTRMIDALMAPETLVFTNKEHTNRQIYFYNPTMNLTIALAAPQKSLKPFHDIGTLFRSVDADYFFQTKYFHKCVREDEQVPLIKGGLPALMQQEPGIIEVFDKLAQTKVSERTKNVILSREFSAVTATEQPYARAADKQKNILINQQTLYAQKTGLKIEKDLHDRALQKLQNSLEASTSHRFLCTRFNEEGFLQSSSTPFAREDKPTNTKPSAEIFALN